MQVETCTCVKLHELRHVGAETALLSRVVRQKDRHCGFAKTHSTLVAALELTLEGVNTEVDSLLKGVGRLVGEQVVALRHLQLH